MSDPAANEASETDAIVEEAIGENVEQAVQVVEQLTSYGKLILEGLPFLIGGLLVVFVLNQLATRVFYKAISGSRRRTRIVFGTLYAMAAVLSVLLLLESRGVETGSLAPMALLIVIAGGVVAFFLVPFFPTLPFKLGNLVDIDGAFGVVDTITPFHTHLQTVDGRTIFIPNPLVLSSRIINYHHTESRRVDLTVRIAADANLERARQTLTDLVAAEERVLPDPPPSLVVTGADADGIDVLCWCWVANADWFATRSDLWTRWMQAVADDPEIRLAVPRQEVRIASEGS